MPRLNLVRLFVGLPLPAGDSPIGRFSAQPLPGLRCCSVGKDAAGCPAILIQTEALGPRAPVAPIVLENLSVLHNVDCWMRSGDGEATMRRVSVIRCRSEDTTLHEYFLRAMSPVISLLPVQPTREQVAEAVNTLVELFRRASQPPRKTVQGLWAELFVIWRATDPAVLLRAWHVEPEERFDFTDDSQRLEVKTALGRSRIHGFSHEQLRPPAGCRALIASVLMERSAGGLSLNDLIDDIRQRISDPELLVRLDSVVAATLGYEWRAAQDERFDRQLAEESIRFLDARSIPSVPDGLPPEVTEVHFRVDLTNHPLNVPEGLSEASGLFAAAFPDRLS